jgi:hypothetical protein
MNILHSQLTRSAVDPRELAELAICDRIIQLPDLSAIGDEATAILHCYGRAIEAHGTDAQAMCRALREMCKSVHELSDLVDGLDEGLGR